MLDFIRTTCDDFIKIQEAPIYEDVAYTKIITQNLPCKIYLPHSYIINMHTQSPIIYTIMNIDPSIEAIFGIYGKIDLEGDKDDISCFYKNIEKRKQPIFYIELKNKDNIMCKIPIFIDNTSIDFHHFTNNICIFPFMNSSDNAYILSISLGPGSDMLTNNGHDIIAHANYNLVCAKLSDDIKEYIINKNIEMTSV